MENEFFKNHLNNPEASKNSIDNMAERLGFVENEELKTIRRQAVEGAALGDIESARALLFEYHLQGEEVVDVLEGSGYTRGQIALIIAKATLYRDTGNLGAFLENVKDAKDYAYNISEAETIAVLEKAPSIEITRILSLLGDEYGFDDETITEIAAEPYSQAFEVAYGYLTQAGLDADEVLKAFIKDLDSSEFDSE